MAPRDQFSFDCAPSRRTLQGGPPAAPTVVVIGAGVAGLAAAHVLKGNNFQVVILESRDRIGGRVFTDYSFGFPVDMGASWLHGVTQRNPLARLIGRLGLPMYRTCDDSSVLYDHDLKSYALFDLEGRKVPPQLVNEVGLVFEELVEESKKIRDEIGGDISVTEAFSIVLDTRADLRQEGLRYKVLQWYICRMEGWFAADAEKISVKSWDEEEMLEGGHGLMIHGYHPMVESLSEGLDIRLKQRVRKVMRRFHNVRVVTEDGTVFDADAALITVPLGVLKTDTVKFEPRLPVWKESAISDLGFGNENKIALFFDKATWPNVEFLGVVAPTSYGCSYFLNLHKATGRPVLVYMPAGSLANDLEKLSNEACANFAVLQLKNILPNAAEPYGYLVSRWGSDANTLGCYSYDKVGKPHDLYRCLRAPVDNLFWAGEATSELHPGTVHGAFATGVQAAEECVESFVKQYQSLELFQQPVMATESGYCPFIISRL